MEKISAELIQQKLADKFGEDLVGQEPEPLYQVPVFRVKSQRIVDVIRFLFDDPELQFQFLTSMFAVHYPDRQGAELDLVYMLHNLPARTRIRIKTAIPIAQPEIDTITPVFSGANWMEREAYDFFGIIFRNHPKLERILNEEEMTYFPMRKEYPLEDNTRIDKDDTMFGRQ